MSDEPTSKEGLAGVGSGIRRESGKKPYQSPALMVYGTIQEVTAVGAPKVPGAVDGPQSG